MALDDWIAGPLASVASVATHPTGGEAINQLALLGVHVRLDGAQLKAGPPAALTDEARAIIRANREPILWALTGFQDARNAPDAPERHPPARNAAGASVAAEATVSAAPCPSPMHGPECSGCAKLSMREEPQDGTRRRFFWRCSAGHRILELHRLGGLVLVAPEDCREHEPWKPGTT